MNKYVTIEGEFSHSPRHLTLNFYIGSLSKSHKMTVVKMLTRHIISPVVSVFFFLNLFFFIYNNSNGKIGL